MNKSCPPPTLVVQYSNDEYENRQQQLSPLPEKSVVIIPAEERIIEDYNMSSSTGSSSSCSRCSGQHYHYTTQEAAVGRDYHEEEHRKQLPLVYLNNHKYKAKQSSSSSVVSIIFMLVLIVAMSMIISIARASFQSVDEDLNALRNFSNEQLKNIEKDVHLLHTKLSELDVSMENKHQKQQQQQELSPFQQMLMEDNDMELSTNNLPIVEGEVHELEHKVNVLKDNAEMLKAKVQAASRKELVAKYGSGVHRVEIELVFPISNSNKKVHRLGELDTDTTDHNGSLYNYEDDGPTTFIIELASSDVMPYSVNFFLDMVSLGLLDGCSFVLNALHVLKAAPLPFETKTKHNPKRTTAAEKAKSFVRAGLESVAFKEYSEQYPHTEYTVGFAVDGSPGFYINTEDNSNVHAGEPCFGKIVSGLDTIQRLENSPTRNGIWFEQRIGIKHASILSIHG